VTQAPKGPLLSAKEKEQKASGRSSAPPWQRQWGSQKSVSRKEESRRFDRRLVGNTIRKL